MFVRKNRPTKTEQTEEELKARYLFVSDEMKRLEQELKQLFIEQDELEAKVRQQATEIIETGFKTSLIDELDKMQREEFELAVKIVNTYKNLMEATQLERRRRLAAAQREYEEKHKLIGSSVSGLGVRHLPMDTGLTMIQTREDLFRSQLQTVGGQRGSGGLNHDILTWELQKEEIVLNPSNKLGQGAFGTVYKGHLRGTPVAVKKLSICWHVGGLDDRSEKIFTDFKNECAVMSKLLHPNVLLLMGVCIEPNSLMLVTELMENGSVADLLHKRPSPPSFKMRMKIAKDCILGMNYLHLNKPSPIVHLDLKTANLLVDSNFVTKVADFGLSKVYSAKEMKGTGGSPAYMAPEILDDAPYDKQADIYSFGILLWELTACKTPYFDQKFRPGTPGLIDVYQHVVAKGKRPHVEEEGTWPPKLKELIERCWDADPTKRPSFQDILDSHVLDEVIVDELISAPNALAREFWKESFYNKGDTEENALVVQWDTFAEALTKFCHLNIDKDDVRWRALKMLLVNSNNEVTIERFSNRLEWFGPFSRGHSLFKRMLRVFSLPGFWGDLSSEEVPNILAGKPAGTYLVRFSGKELGFYTLTIKKIDIQNIRISHGPGTPYVLEHEFKSLRKLIKFYKEELGLKYPLKGSKYNQLLVADKEGDTKNYYNAFVTTQQGSVLDRTNQ
jgi:serine/threonine protein kinase